VEELLSRERLALELEAAMPGPPLAVVLAAKR
jgi:hypothetical protein